MKKNKSKKKKSLKIIVYIVLRILVILTMIRQIMQGNITNAITCLVTLILFLIPNIIDKKFKIEFPDILEITVYIFLFSTEILGEVNEFYVHINNWDAVMHTLSGFVIAGIGVSLVNILNKENHLKLKPIYIVFFGFCFSMAISAIWEIFEYTVDRNLHKDMQKDTIITEITSVKLNSEGKNKSKTIKIESLEVNGENWLEKYGGYIDVGINDTMEDLIVNLAGALIFSALSYSYFVGKVKTAENFMLRKKEE